jgi:hypothetical protein
MHVRDGPPIPVTVRALQRKGSMTARFPMTALRARHASTIAFAFLVAACNGPSIASSESFEGDEKEFSDDKDRESGGRKTPEPGETPPRLAPGLPDASKCLAARPDVEGLELTITPEAATVTGPPALLAKIEEYRARRQGCAAPAGAPVPDFAIDWGDDPGQTRQDYSGQPRDEDGCTSLVTHRYSVEGAYVIGGYLYRPGPNGVPVPEWFAQTRITLASLTPRALAFELTAPATSTTLTWQKDLDVAWTWSPDRPLMMEIAAVSDVVSASGSPEEQVIASEVFCPAAYLGPGKSTLHFAGEAYEQALRNGPKSARIRTRVFDFDGVVFDRTSPPVVLSPEYVKDANRATGAVGGARDATLTFTAEHPDCGSWRIEWGDGLAETREGPPGAACSATATPIVRQHVYATAGSYEIRIKSNDRVPTKPIAEVTPYEKVVITVP